MFLASGDVLAYRIQVRSSDYSQNLFCLLLVPWLKPSSSPTVSLRSIVMCTVRVIALGL